MYWHTHDFRGSLTSPLIKKHHTALATIQNSILLAIDKKQCVLLVQFDLSAAFDTVEYTLLPQRLSSDLSVTCTALHDSVLIVSWRPETKCPYQVCEIRNRGFTVSVSQGSVLGKTLRYIHKSIGGYLWKENSHHYRFYGWHANVQRIWCQQD